MAFHKKGPPRIADSQRNIEAMRHTESNLTPKMKQMRDRFINEYLKDFQGPLAYIRAGGPATTATKMSNQFLREPYVASEIQKCIERMEPEILVTRQKILAGLLREANYFGVGTSHGARVSAWAHLAKIQGLIEDKLSVKGEIKAGVMVVPMPSPNDWEKLAGESQQLLKDAVKE